MTSSTSHTTQVNEKEQVPDGTRIISSIDVREYADTTAIIDGVEAAFRSYQGGDATMPPKSYVGLPEVNGDFRSMPAQVGAGAGVKWV